MNTKSYKIRDSIESHIGSYCLYQKKLYLLQDWELDACFCALWVYLKRVGTFSKILDRIFPKCVLLNFSKRIYDDNVEEIVFPKSGTLVFLMERQK